MQFSRGIALGFLWNSTKDPLAILVGATAVGMAGVLVLPCDYARTTRLKQDASLGIVLSSFYAVGVCLVDYIQRASTGNKSGIKSFLFGQASALSGADVALMAVTSAITLACIFLLHRNLVTTCFDRAFAGAIGSACELSRSPAHVTDCVRDCGGNAGGGCRSRFRPPRHPGEHRLPPLADRMPGMLWIAAVGGMISAATGAFLSFLGNNLPTGPLIVVSAALLFLLAFLFAPRHGWLTRVFRRRSRWRKTRRENTLKVMYKILEDRNFDGEDIPVVTVAEVRKEPLEEVAQRWCATWSVPGSQPSATAGRRHISHPTVSVKRRGSSATTASGNFT